MKGLEARQNFNNEGRSEGNGETGIGVREELKHEICEPEFILVNVGFIIFNFEKQ